MSDLKSQTIYRALRERILSNEIVSGTRLVLRQLANAYETSDIPVREALRMLERDGLVEMVPYRGARVTTLTAREIEETYFIRGHLESIATGLAAERITDAELDALDVLMERMREAVSAQDGPGFSDLNHEFHSTIVGACGNEMLRDLTMDIWQRHSGFQRVFRMVPERLAASQSEHEGIMDALRARDAKRAAALALWHKRSVGDTVSTLVDDEGSTSTGGRQRVGSRREHGRERRRGHPRRRPTRRARSGSTTSTRRSSRASGASGPMLALEDVAFDARPGEFVSLVGPVGLRQVDLPEPRRRARPAPSAGAVEHHGRPVRGVNTADRLHHAGRQPAAVAVAAGQRRARARAAGRSRAPSAASARRSSSRSSG